MSRSNKIAPSTARASKTGAPRTSKASFDAMVHDASSVDDVSKSKAAAGDGLLDNDVPVPTKDSAAPHTSEHARMLMFVYLALVMIGFGGMQYLFRLQVYKYGADHLTSGTFQACLLFGSFTGYGAFVLFHIRHIHPRNIQWVHLTAFVAGICNNSANNAFMLLTQDGGEASLLSPLTSLYVLVPVVLGLTFLGERLTILKAVGMVFSLGAICLFAFGDASGDLDLSDGRTIGLFFVAFFGWGLGKFLLSWMGLKANSNTSTLGISFLCHSVGFCSSSAVFVVAVHRDYETGWNRGHTLIYFSGILASSGNAFYVLLTRVHPSASTIAPLASLFVIIPIVLGMATLHESFTATKMAGIVVALFAIVLMNWKRPAKINKVADVEGQQLAESAGPTTIVVAAANSGNKRNSAV